MLLSLCKCHHVSTVAVYVFLSLYVNVGTIYSLNFFGEWYIFIAVQALFCCGNCIVKANKNGQ